MGRAGYSWKPVSLHVRPVCQPGQVHLCLKVSSASLFALCYKRAVLSSFSVTSALHRPAWPAWKMDKDTNVTMLT